MAVKYWVANGATANANDAASWNTAANGTGSTGKPAGNDTAVFGDSVTLAAKLGYASCNWNYATIGGLPQIDEVFVNDAYGDSVSLRSNIITFTGSTIVLNDNQLWIDIGFSVGMSITVSGSKSNDGTHIITGITTATATCSATTFTGEVVASGTYTVGVSSDERKITLAENMYVQALRLGCKLDAASAKSVVFSGAIISSSAYNSADYTNRYVLNGKHAGFPNIGNITYSIDGAS